MARWPTAGGSGAADAVLATRAAAGDGEAFAMLYDRHERRVYGFCLRMLGTPDEAGDATQETFMRVLGRLPALGERELNFVAYVLTTARHACLDAIAARRRVEPVGEHDESAFREPSAIEEDPERAALLGATRQQVEAANAKLPERQRAALALREVEELSYEQVGELLELSANAVAQLISRARINLRSALRTGALTSVAAATPDCERALPLLAALQDDRAIDLEELAWLHDHLADCGTCSVRREAMEEAGISYRLLLPVVPLVWLRQATIARAADLVGADWSGIARHGPGGGDRGSGGHGSGSRGGGGPGQADLGRPGSPGSERDGDLELEPGAGEPSRRRRRLRRGALAGAILTAFFVLALAGSLARDRFVAVSPARADLPAHASRTRDAPAVHGPRVSRKPRHVVTRRRRTKARLDHPVRRVVPVTPPATPVVTAVQHAAAAPETPTSPREPTIRKASVHTTTAQKPRTQTTAAHPDKVAAVTEAAPATTVAHGTIGAGTTPSVTSTTTSPATSTPTTTTPSGASSTPTTTAPTTTSTQTTTTSNQTTTTSTTTTPGRGCTALGCP